MELIDAKGDACKISLRIHSNYKCAVNETDDKTVVGALSQPFSESYMHDCVLGK